jgi:DNA-binding transcriptional LysR family regulator
MGSIASDNERMELRELELLLACVEAGGFTAGARRAHAAQPTLSLAIKRLEEELGLRLLVRPRARGERLAPTEAGELVLQLARGVRDLRRETASRLGELGGPVRGEVTVGAAPSLATSLLPLALASLRARAPGVRVAVEVGPSDTLVESLRAGSLDAAVVAEVAPTVRRALLVTPLFEEPFVAVAGRGLPLGQSTTLRELAKGPLLLPLERVFHGQLVREAFARAGVERLEPVATLGSAEALLAAARAGLGYAVLPRRSVPRSRELRVARLRGEGLKRTVRLLERAGARERRAVGAVLSAIELAARSTRA